MKLFASPYPWLLLTLGALLLTLCRRHVDAKPETRRLVGAACAVWVALLLLSLRPVSVALGRTLIVTDSPVSAPPSVILVLGDGLSLGRDSADDRITLSQWSRARRAIAWWRESPSARIVLSGQSAARNRPPERLAVLTREVLLAAGVPDSLIVMEPRSRVTREHPAEALRIPGLQRDTPVGIVTSEWHMRRARAVFRAEFASVQWRSADISEWTPSWLDVVPSAESLSASAFDAVEWVGSVVYGARRLFSTRELAAGAPAA